MRDVVGADLSPEALRGLFSPCLRSRSCVECRKVASALEQWAAKIYLFHLAGKGGST
ncbi:MAG: hypothetical protein QXP31_10370 [Pyrobaculum sp.]